MEGMTSESFDARFSRIVTEELTKNYQRAINTSTTDALHVVANAVVPGIAQTAVDRALEAKVKDITDNIDKLLKERRPRKVQFEIRQGDKVLTLETRQHRLFPLVAKYVAAGVPILLTGPAGSGKSTLAENVATALGLTFVAQSFSEYTSKGDLLGMRDAHEYRRSQFREIFEHGGVYIADEMDCSGPILTLLNSAIANGYLAFPDAFVKAHRDFRLIACANTFGTGANSEYVSRNRLDAAVLDRYATLVVGYDDDVESAACGMETDAGARRDIDCAEGGEVAPIDWIKIVRRARTFIAQQKIKHVVSPRASIYGAKLIDQGVGRNHLMDSLILKGLQDPLRAQVYTAAIGF